jgi:hypothetical protein
MEDKSGSAGESIILGFTAWVWLLPFACIYSDKSVDEILSAVLQLSITSGAIILAFLTLTTSVLGVIGEKLSFIAEKIVVGPTSNPRHWYTKRVEKLTTEDWYAAQERIWESPQAYKEFVGARLGVLLGRTLFLNCGIALLVFAFAFASHSWHKHFSLILGVAALGLIFSLASWWISTGAYLAIVRVAGDIEKRKKAEEIVVKQLPAIPEANPPLNTDVPPTGVAPVS